MTDPDLFSLELSSTSRGIHSDSDESRKRSHSGSSFLYDDMEPSYVNKEFYDDRVFIADLLKQYQALTIIPQSSKVIVIDTEVSILAAFQALEENDIDSAPLWDSEERDFKGFISIGDLIVSFLEAVGDHKDMDEEQVMSIMSTLEETTIKESRLGKNYLISIDPGDNLYDACWAFVRNQVYRLPVIDKAENNTILYSLSANRIISFLMRVIKEMPLLFTQPLEKLQIGTFSNVKSLTNETSLGECLNILGDVGFAALPIVDSMGKAVDTLYKADISLIPLALILKHFNDPIAQVLEDMRKEKILKLRNSTCKLSDPFERILSRMVDMKSRSLIVVDEETYLVGVIALADMMKLFIVS